MRDKQHMETGICIWEERDSFQLHPPIRRFPACISAWWHWQGMTVGSWSVEPCAGDNGYAAACCMPGSMALPLMPELLCLCRRCLSYPHQDSGFLSFKPHGLHTTTPCFIGSCLHVHFTSKHPCLLSSSRCSFNNTRRGVSPGTVCTSLDTYSVIKRNHNFLQPAWPHMQSTVAR